MGEQGAGAEARRSGTRASVWSAAGCGAPRRFGFFRRGPHEGGVSPIVGRRSKAPSPLRSAGAVQKLRQAESLQKVTKLTKRIGLGQFSVFWQEIEKPMGLRDAAFRLARTAECPTAQRVRNDRGFRTIPEPSRWLGRCGLRQAALRLARIADAPVAVRKLPRGRS